MKDLYFLGVDHNNLAFVELTRYYKGWMITQIKTPDHKHERQLLRDVLDDADAEGVILYLGIDPNDHNIYQLPELWYVKYRFQKYRGKYRRRPVYKSGS